MYNRIIVYYSGFTNNLALWTVHPLYGAKSREVTLL